MNRLRPSLSSYARVSYGRELIGDTAAAIARDEARVDAATGRRRADGLDARPARQALLRTTAATPRPSASTAFALAGLPGLRVRARRARAGARPRAGSYRAGDRGRAAGGRARSRCRSTSRRSATSTRSPAGPALAQRQYALIGAIEKLLRANGVKTDLEIALFQVDHGIRLRHALELARARARASGPRSTATTCSPGRSRATAAAPRPLPYSQARAPPRHAGRAEVLPPRDDRALPRARRAPRATWFRRALALNPHFSLLWAPVAEEATRDEAAARPARRSGRGARAGPMRASAHPLGNFTVNRYSRLERRGNRLYVLYVLDLAEIPTFQARRAAPGRSTPTATPRRIAATPATSTRRRPAARCSSRCAACSRSPRARAGLTHDAARGRSSGARARRREPGSPTATRNYAGRIGWKEIVVRPSAGARLPGSSAPEAASATGCSPTRRTCSQSPLDVVSARRRVEPGRAAGRAARAASPRRCSSSARPYAPSPTAASRA